MGNDFERSRLRHRPRLDAPDSRRISRRLRCSWPHQEINASREEPLSCVLVRSGQEPIVVNLEIVPAEPPEEVYWVDDIHSPPS
jgi:hypothetical protein